MLFVSHLAWYNTQNYTRPAKSSPWSLAIPQKSHHNMIPYNLPMMTLGSKAVLS